MQLDKLLKDPEKAAYIPPPPKDKSLRPAREMMKNVQGSSAGAGSGEFHVYKAGRRREYERLKMLDDEVQKVSSGRSISLLVLHRASQETDEAEFARKKREAEAVTEAKTVKNRAKRQKKKGRSKEQNKAEGRDGEKDPDAPIKKRRLVNGKELVFRRPGEDSDGGDDDDGPQALLVLPTFASTDRDGEEVNDDGPVVAEPRITIHEDD